MSKQVIIASVISGLVGAAAGGAIAYLTTKKTFEARAQQAIDEVKQTYHDKFDGLRVVHDYSADTDGDEVKTPLGRISKEEMAQAKEFVENLQYHMTAGTAEPEEEEERTINIYDRQVHNPPGEEVEHRLLVGYSWEDRKKAHKPYLISHEEFATTENEWDKTDIHYYEDDDVLAGEDGQPITDIDYLIGEEHLDFFGIRSAGDKNKVYIRNPQISTDFEVTRNSGAYTELVLGIQKDSDKVGTRRMRNGADD